MVGIDLREEIEKAKIIQNERKNITRTEATIKTAEIIGLNVEEIKQQLKEERQEKELKDYDEKKINFLEGNFWDSWDKVKGHAKKIMGHHDEYNEGDENKLVFLAHSQDVIRGKPQLVENVMKKIPMVRICIKKEIEGKGENKVEIELKKVFFFDEKFDKRYDGYQKSCLSLDFWLYRVFDMGREFYIYSEKELGNQVYEFHGMLIEVDDYAELSRSLKLKSLSNIFILKNAKPTARIMPKEELVEMTRQLKEKIDFDEQGFYDMLATHPNGSINRFSKEFEKLRASWVLSSKADDYPLHLWVWGRAGTKKTMGIIETTSSKFNEDCGILEGGNSRIKSLVPSFKEKPANIGYLAKCERVGFVDEIGKLLEFEKNSHRDVIQGNILGDLNFLLEHKERLVGSGNSNEVKVQATGKFIFSTNPMSRMQKVSSHVGTVDATTMSRFFHWVQDNEECLNEIKVERKPAQTHTRVYTSSWRWEEEKKRKYSLVIIFAENNINNDSIEPINSKNNLRGNFNPFLSIYDTCNSFLCDLDFDKVNGLVQEVLTKTSEPMASSVWIPRGEHHVKLLVDGLCKIRCLFKDYDSSFTVKEEDYQTAKEILMRMVNGWETILTPQEVRE